LTTPDGTSESGEPSVPPPDLDLPPSAPRLGASTFTIEGRAVPALFVLGWLASLLGFGLVIVGILAGAIVAPLGEELLFRGFATTAWVRGVGIRQGVIRAALVFAFAHVLTTSGTSAGDALGLAVVGFGTRVPIALALGWLFVRRKTIWAPFGLHAAFNASLLVIAEAAARGG
jgi:membrane protease YdiL (CAAX protease family)